MAKILVIDDQESMRSIITQMLREKGYQVKTAGDGAEGLNIFEQDPASFNLILADVNMPKVDGFEFLKKVKAQQPQVPVILITGTNKEAAAYFGKEFKADGVINKPFVVEETMAVVEKLIAGSR